MRISFAIPGTSPALCSPTGCLFVVFVRSLAAQPGRVHVSIGVLRVICLCGDDQRPTTNDYRGTDHRPRTTDHRGRTTDERRRTAPHRRGRTTNDRRRRSGARCRPRMRHEYANGLCRRHYPWASTCVPAWSSMVCLQRTVFAYSCRIRGRFVSYSRAGADEITAWAGKRGGRSWGGRG